MDVDHSWEKPCSSPPILHVVLYRPEIPQNTGNIGRTCVAVGARLWMIRPLGFRLDARDVRRAGLDYWQHLDYRVVDDWQEIRRELPTAQVWCVDNPAPRTIWEARYQPGDILLFGNEGSGLPASLKAAFRQTLIQLPMRPLVRSLNLASTVNTVVYEAIRQWGGLPDS
ncbi:MAG: putative tRNA (cytidine(34)-2'-O)-methyltransferase [Planctomycetaceae bacterium]|nr:MAG: putative tRNA (cytidine(34)-2'-O)-methyltransferase [Planctomycetaceae bacterium]